jgi:tetratricopeptide (TPR) repeat protein
MARLDRVPTVRGVAQLGAVLGREFAYEILKELTTIEESALQERLAQLVNAELLYQRGRPPRARFFFKHALIRDAAYESLLRSTRQHYHQQIAQLFEGQFLDLVEAQPELVAHHYTEAGLAERAIGYWQRAGQRAVGRSANAEAIRHLNKGLEVLSTLPDSPDRAEQELTLQTTLGPALIATKGYTAAEVERAYARARELCEGVADTPQLLLVLRGLQLFYLVRGGLHTARELSEQMLRVAQGQNDRALQVEAHLALGETLLFLGEQVSARENLEQGWALYDVQLHRFEDWPGSHPAHQCLIWEAMALWALGYPDQALHRSREWLTLAQELAHPYSLAMAHIQAAPLHQLRREPQAALKQAEAGMTLATEQGFPAFVAWGTFYRGAALAALGRDSEGVSEGVAQMRQGLAAFQAAGALLGLSGVHAQLAAEYGKIGKIDEGLATLAEGLRLVDKNGERHREAELHRLKGELTLQSRDRSVKSGVEKAAEECFQQALIVARAQQTKSWELRATISLSRLRQRQGKQDEARDLLAEIYGWFIEGFDTADLKEAKALLEELEA